ncbi:MFS transporter [Auraticoccus monumenti]|uniref:Predicted arabinose efflux permease, MFS family n=1 Tax=Auraticoccus monumenti TaxID=675864 RepID=A0A1G6Y7N3_9ACTN|nr:MFS transporter [Auraticoccus monumenti]SDD86504.1 Predicted arabinose efflux permease, MFS family [Auraticoccus monumenti]
MSAPLTPTAARRVFLLLTVTRWFPIGLVVGVMTLLPLERGLSVAATLTALALTGWVVFALELPTSSVADALGRRPVYLVASLVQVAAAAVYLVADSFWGFALAAGLMGVFRALDSGPLEAWFVDTVHATTPGADVDGHLSAQSTVLGVSISAGALVSGGLVWWHPVASSSALALPFAVYLALAAAHVAAVLVWLKEPARSGTGGAGGALASAREAPAVVRDGLRLLGRSPVLRGLVVVEVFWSVAMVVFETFQPIRLAELLGSGERAGAWMGAVAAAGWGVFSAGSALAGRASRRIGVTRTAVLARVLNGLGAVTMGLVAGPVALVAAYLVTYGLHGAGGPVHSALLHREAHSGNRATVLSMNSMMAFAAFSLATPLLGLLAERTSTPVAMVTAGALSVLGALWYLPARRQERRRLAETAAVPV